MKEKRGYKAFQKYLEIEFEKTATILGLTDIRFIIPAEPRKGEATMSIEYRHPYKKALIWWSWRDYIAFHGRAIDKDHFKHAILHECLHIILWELSKAKITNANRRRIEESTTDHLANVILKLL